MRLPNPSRPRPPTAGVPTPPTPRTLFAGPAARRRGTGPLGWTKVLARRHPLLVWSLPAALALGLGILGVGEPVDPVTRGQPTGTVVPDTALGLAARVPAGWSAVAVPADARTPPLLSGQRVDLYAPPATAVPALVPTREPADGQARALGTGALVLDADGRHVIVAVRNADVASVSAALLDGPVLIALTPGR